MIFIQLHLCIYLIPKIVIPKLQDVTPFHAELMGYLMAKVPVIASKRILRMLTAAYLIMVQGQVRRFIIFMYILSLVAFNWPWLTMTFAGI